MKTTWTFRHLALSLLLGTAVADEALAHERESRTLRVLGPSREPIPGAEVWVWIENGTINWERVNRWELEVETQRRGVRLSTDAKGEVDLPWFDKFARVAAKADDLFAYFRFSRGSENRFELTLRPESGLEVQDSVQTQGP